jgi:hypothetical protein
MMTPQALSHTAGILTALLTRPGAFFATRFDGVTSRQAIGVLSLSGLFFALSGALVDPGGASLRRGVVLFINAVGMAGLGSVIGYLAVAMLCARRQAFARLWKLFALSTAAVLLIAWVPYAFIFTEPWKWWLIGTGMVSALGLSKPRAVMVVLLSFGILVLTVYSMMAITQFAVARMG